MICLSIRLALVSDVRSQVPQPAGWDERQTGACRHGLGRRCPVGMVSAVGFLHSSFSHPSWERAVSQPSLGKLPVLLRRTQERSRGVLRKQRLLSG